MTREEIAKAARTVLTEAIDAFQELARETQGFSDLQPVTVYLKHVRAVADSQLSKLHQDAGNAAEPFFRLAREVINPVNGERPWHADSKDWMVVFSFAGQSITLGDLRRAAAADALERGSQVADGWVLVPREPTAEMLDAVCDRRNPAGRACYRGDWHAMIAAAPAHGGGG